MKDKFLAEELGLDPYEDFPRNDAELTKDDFKNVGFKEFLKDLLSIRFIVGLIFWIGFVYFLIGIGD